MKLKSFLTKLFKGYEILEVTNSPINGEIKVVGDLFGGRSMIIGGVSQSGYLVGKLWKIALSRILNFKFQISNCLVLGLGCGNAAKIVSERFPGCKVVGVEIDPKVIEMGEKYFELGGVENLKIVIGDAIEEIKNVTAVGGIPSESGKKLKIKNTKKKLKNIDEEKFDLILVDLYLGKEYPKEAESEDFINGVREVLTEGGIALFNRLSFGEYHDGAVRFSKKLHNFFSKVWAKKAITNLLIFCR